MTWLDRPRKRTMPSRNPQPEKPRVPPPILLNLDDKPTFNLEEAALFFGVHGDTLRRWVMDGELKAFRTPGGKLRIPRAEIVELVRRRQVLPSIPP